VKILVSTPTFLPVVGGAELGIHEIYSRLGHRHEVTILTPVPADRSVQLYGSTDSLQAPYRIHELLPNLSRSGPGFVSKAVRRSSLPYIWEIRQLLARERFDVANFHYISPHGGALQYTTRVRSLPTMLSLVGRQDVVRLLPFGRRRYAERVLAAASSVAPISRYYLEDLRRVRHLQVIPYGVDTNSFAPSARSDNLRRSLGVNANDFLLLTVQRLTNVKRVDVVIRAMAQVVRRRANVVLAVVGQGEEMERLQALTLSLGLQDHVRFVGYVSNDALPNYFASADAFVFHSLFETFGIVFAQAMSSGLPIVAARTSCVPEVVLPANGSLVAPFDLDAFADAVLAYLEDGARRHEVGAANRVRARAEFDWDQVAFGYETELRRLVDANVAA
jgi:glycosyltransferase involved in cell wall biosynthesis